MEWDSDNKADKEHAILLQKSDRTCYMFISAVGQFNTGHKMLKLQFFALHSLNFPAMEVAP